MPLRLVIGRANAGKTGLILGWALEALERRESPTLVVPNLADVRRLQHELSGKAVLGVRVMTVSTLMEELWLLHGDGRRVIGDATRAAVIRELLENVAIAESDGSAAATQGFARLMERLATQSLPQGRVNTKRLGAGGELALSLLEAYRRELAELDFIEAGWIGALLSQTPPSVGYLGVLRFVSHSQEQISFYRALSATNDVAVALTWEEGFAPTVANKGAASVLLEAAAEVHVVEELTGDSELDELASCLFACPSPVVASGSVVLGEAAGKEGEAALVARMAAAAVESGVSAERIAIVFPQLNDRVAVVRGALAAEGLEADFDCSPPVAMSPFGRALIALAALASGRGGRTQALEYLQGPFSDARSSDVIDLDRSWRQSRRPTDARRILQDMSRLSERTGHAVHLVQAATRGNLTAETASKWQELADSLIAVAALRDPAAVAADDAGVHRAVTRAVSQMASVAGHPFVSADVIDSMSSVSYGSGAEETPGRIQVIQASRVGSRRFDHVIVGGLTRSESPGFSRETFASEVGSVASGQERSDDEFVASLEFYSLITRARERLCLVRQTTNSEGELQLPSPLLEDVVAAYRDGSDSSMEGNSTSSTANPLPLETCSDGRAFVPVFTAGRRELRLVAEAMPYVTRRITHARIEPELARRAAKQRIYSATEVQTYLECPYRWFYSRMLRPREIDRELDAASLGTLAHDLLATFYKAASAADMARVTRANLPAALELFERVVAEAEAKMPRTRSIGEQIDVQRAMLWARRVVEDDADLWPGYLPVGHEEDFGSEATFEFAGVSFRGRIDRIDSGPAGLIITDYKSTSNVQPLVGPGVQHVLYALAAEQVKGQPVLGSVYRSLRSRMIRGFYRRELLDRAPVDAARDDVIDEVGYAEVLERTEERVSQAIAGMQSGEIPRKLQARATCGYCPLKLICEGAN